MQECNNRARYTTLRAKSNTCWLQGERECALRSYAVQGVWRQAAHSPRARFAWRSHSPDSGCAGLARLDAAHRAASVPGSPKARSALARRLCILVLGNCRTGVGRSERSAWVQDAGEKQGDERRRVQPPFSVLAGLSSASSLKLKVEATSIWILTERASIAARGAYIGAKKAPAARAKRATRSANGALFLEVEKIVVSRFFDEPSSANSIVLPPRSELEIVLHWQ